jgi:hypothetical protein
MNKGKFYSDKCQEHNYSPELQKCIEDACKYCLDTVALKGSENDIEKSKHPIMMLGKIQSGKTRAFTGLMALAFDNQFDMVFILSKNSKALIEQTYKRMRREFKEFIYNNEVEVFNIMKNVIDDLTDYELDKKLIIIAKKEKRNLDKISKFISDYTIHQRKNCIIIDDEADTTGIGFSKSKDSDDTFDLRTVASKVNEIRGSLEGCVFVQVTATPYALYLQPEFDETDIKPIKPQKTVLVPSGNGYIGGEYYFLESKNDDHPGQYIYEPVSDDEHELISLKKDDRRRLKVEEILIRKDKLPVFKKGLVNFIIGGSVLRMANKNTHYSYVIHTATQKNSHIRLENITQEFFNQIKNRTPEIKSLIDDMVLESYNDIKKSVEAYGYTMPSLEGIKSSFYNAIDKDYISVTIVNDDNDVDKFLDEDNGELKLRTPFSIFVGGQVLDRGVTIPRMIGFYYGRNPKTMQQDTVMQHSRMFGYREKDWLSVTRFYTTKRIYENMTKITEIDVALREDIENGNFNEGIYFIQRKDDDFDDKGKIVPCSPSKILLSNIVLLRSSYRLLPVGFTPIARSYATKIVQKINNILLKIMNENEKGAILAPLNYAEEIIKLCYSAIKPDEGSERFISEDRFLTTMRYLTNGDKIHIIVRRNRRVTKYKNNGITYQNAPDTGHQSENELQIARSIAINKPVLMLIHQDGTAEGWNGSEFWWPILVTPKNIKKTIFAMPGPEGRIRTRFKVV